MWGRTSQLDVFSKVSVKRSGKMASIAEVLVDAPEIGEEERDADAVDSSLLSPGRAASIRKICIPRLLDNFSNLLTKARLRALKQYLGSFQYRHNPQKNFSVHKVRPLTRILDTARMIVHAPQPIKCVEADL
ncbi:uncharacterized protein [Physcomitrium patens]|uniref:uncharacterized protein isoform X3 n=1 Tax=Physcomitrium patens TaxID=3218 RepID=UPI003CCD6F3A